MITCHHCGLTLAVRRPPAAGEKFYCCLGCRLAAAAGEGDDGPRRFLEARLVFSAFLAMGVMAGNLVLYGEDIYATGDEPGLVVVRRLAQIGTAVFAVPVLLLLGTPLLRGAWTDLRRGIVRMDGLIVLGTVAAFLISLYHTIVGEGPVYYETAVTVLVVVMFGRRLEAHARSEARDAASAVADLLPKSALVVVDGVEVARKPEELCAGDRVRIAPGTAFPADVRVTVGRGSYVAGHVTGEAAPQAIAPEEVAPAGAVNGATALEGVVVRPWSEGALGRIRTLLNAPVPMTRVIRHVDRLAGKLAYLSIALALIGGVRTGLAEGAGEGLRTALAVLLCACPCALGLAIPLSYRAIRTALARRGVLVNDPAALENALQVRHAVVDKTGTLTEPAAAEIVVETNGTAAAARMASLVGASGHPLAKALAGAADDAVRATVLRAELISGRGVRGRFADAAGTTLEGDALAGDPTWLDAEGVAWSPRLLAARERFASRGLTLVGYAENGRTLAVAGVEHRLRDSARAVVEELAARGVAVEIASGDRPQATAEIAAKLGVPFAARATPEDKAVRVRELARNGARVMAVGDGVNDAPFLRAADVGVAVASGTAAARAEAQIELAGDDLRGLVVLLDGARALRRNVRGNLFWTLVYNGVALGAATVGKLHPLLAVAMMTVSSLVVAFRAHRLLAFGASEATTSETATAATTPAALAAARSPAESSPESPDRSATTATAAMRRIRSEAAPAAAAHGAKTTEGV
jgi:heavy metal translocating P-type ATPase